MSWLNLQDFKQRSALERLYIPIECNTSICFGEERLMGSDKIISGQLRCIILLKYLMVVWRRTQCSFVAVEGAIQTIAALLVD